MKILGLDPATCTGFAHTDGHVGVWRMDRFGSDPGDRLCAFRRKLLAAHKDWGYHRLAFEEASFGAGAHGAKGVQWSAMAMHFQMRGIVLLVAAELSIDVVSYHPSTIKKFATGFGHATKDQMMRACKLQFGFEPHTSDVADARFVLAMAEQGYVVESRAKAARPKRATKPKSPRLF